MWDGNRNGPRGGKPFRGNNRGEMFGGRDGPMQDFRNRDGMNMGPMGPMGPMMGPSGPRPQDRPPMDMRSDGPPDMRGRDMEPLGMRGREPNRDFFRPGDEPDFSLRRQYEIVIRDKLMNAPGFMGPGRNNVEMGGRGMEQREPNDRLMDMRDREMFRNKMPGFSNSNQDARRGFPMGPMGRNDGFRDMRDRDRPPMGMDDIDGCNMDMGQRDRGMMGFDRRGGPPFNTRGGFDSDMDFRNRMGSPADFRGRDRSPLRFGENDGAPMDVRGRPDHLGGPNRSKFGEEGNMRDRARENSPIDYRGGEEMSLAEEWKNRRARERDSQPAAMSRSISPFPRDGIEPGFPSSMGRDGNKPTHVKERDRPPTDFPGKEVGGFGGFPRPDPEHPGPPNWEKNPPAAPLPGVGLLPLGLKGPHVPPFPTMGLLANPHRENDGKRWPGDRDPKQNPNVRRDDRPPFHQEKNQPSQQTHGPAALDCFKGPKDPAGPERPKMGPGPGPEFPSNSGEQRRDQDYRDIDYRTGPGRAFEYKREDLQSPEKILKESKQVPVSKFTDSGSQDQDYRSASMKDKVSHTISITGIPKTATMEQILGAFAVRDGVPMQGMKIKNVVPGYSYDTAYVEFFNLDDAVHFMESNQGSLKVGTKVASMRYVQPDRNAKDAQEPGLKAPPGQEPLLPGLPEKAKNSQSPPQAAGGPAGPVDPLSQGQWQRSSDLTPEAWQQQVDQQLRQKEAEQQAESWASRNAPRHGPHQTDPIFKESKTMILKNVKPTTTVETILKALDPFAYLDERNVRLVKGKPPGAKCFCFVDMDSHEQVTRLVDLLTKPRPLSIDGDRVYAEVAKPLKNQMYKRDSDKSNTSLLGYPPETSMLEQQQHYFPQGLPPAVIQGDLIGSLGGSSDPALSSGSHMAPSLASYGEAPPMDPSFQALGPHVSAAASGLPGTAGSEAYSYATETPDMTDYLYDATSGFYYDPQTTLYYDPSSRYFYNAQTQEYLFWDSVSKTYIPVPGGTSDTQTPMGQPVTMAADVQAILANPAADAPLEMKKPSELPPVPLPDPGSAPEPGSAPLPTDPASAANLERRDEDDASHSDKKDKDEKPRSLAAFKIMKDMERWAKIQNRQKDSVRAPSPVLKGGADDRKASKAADAAFAIFERKGSGGDDLFKKPFAPPTKKDEKSSKRPMGSLGLLASDYAAGSDEEEEAPHDAPRAPKSQSEEKEDKLTDWKKMACLLCRRQFPNKDALMRHQQLSDLHKQNMEIHLKIKRSKKELEALENQEKELSARESTRSPEIKKRKHQPHQHQPHQHQPHQHQNTWASGSRDSHKGSERPGLGSEPVERKKKEAVVWDHATYKQAVRKAMFARFKELD